MLPLLALAALSACQNSSSLRQFTPGEQLASYDFSEPDSFEEGSYGAATLRIANDVYTIEVFEGDNALWWGQWGENYTDTMIDVDVEQTTERNENAYGVMCRVRGSVGLDNSVDPTLAALLQDTTPVPEVTAEMTAESTMEATADAAASATADATAEATAEMTMEAAGAADATSEATAESTVESTSEVPPISLTPSARTGSDNPGDGYLFLIQGNGQFAIMRSRGRSLTALVNWTQSDAINKGVARNHIRAICSGNYLAMYVNDKFMADTTDEAYSSGQVGLVASAASRLGTRIEFDNLVISKPVSG